MGMTTRNVQPAFIQIEQEVRNIPPMIALKMGALFGILMIFPLTGEDPRFPGFVDKC